MKSADEMLRPWPRAWMGIPEDKVFGEQLIAELKPFVESLIERGFAKKTMDRHLNNLFLMGGEIIRDISMDEDYEADPATVLRDAVMCGEGPLCRHLHTEEEQRTYDATCRKLHKFLEECL